MDNPSDSMCLELDSLFGELSMSFYATSSAPNVCGNDFSVCSDEFVYDW